MPIAGFKHKAPPLQQRSTFSIGSDTCDPHQSHPSYIVKKRSYDKTTRSRLSMLNTSSSSKLLKIKRADNIARQQLKETREAKKRLSDILMSLDSETDPFESKHKSSIHENASRSLSEKDETKMPHAPVISPSAASSKKDQFVVATPGSAKPSKTDIQHLTRKVSEMLMQIPSQTEIKTIPAPVLQTAVSKVHNSELSEAHQLNSSSQTSLKSGLGAAPSASQQTVDTTSSLSYHAPSKRKKVSRHTKNSERDFTKECQYMGNIIVSRTTSGRVIHMTGVQAMRVELKNYIDKLHKDPIMAPLTYEPSEDMAYDLRGPEFEVYESMAGPGFRDFGMTTELGYDPPIDKEINTDEPMCTAIRQYLCMASQPLPTVPCGSTDENPSTSFNQYSWFHNVKHKLDPLLLSAHDIFKINKTKQTKPDEKPADPAIVKSVDFDNQAAKPKEKKEIPDKSAEGDHKKILAERKASKETQPVRVASVTTEGHQPQAAVVNQTVGLIQEGIEKTQEQKEEKIIPGEPHLHNEKCPDHCKIETQKKGCLIVELEPKEQEDNSKLKISKEKRKQKTAKVKPKEISQSQVKDIIENLKFTKTPTMDWFPPPPNQPYGAHAKFDYLPKNCTKWAEQLTELELKEYRRKHGRYIELEAFPVPKGNERETAMMSALPGVDPLGYQNPCQNMPHSSKASQCIPCSQQNYNQQDCGCYDKVFQCTVMSEDGAIRQQLVNMPSESQRIPCTQQEEVQNSNFRPTDQQIYETIYKEMQKANTNQINDCRCGQKASQPTTALPVPRNPDGRPCIPYIQKQFHQQQVSTMSESISLSTSDLPPYKGVSKGTNIKQIDCGSEKKNLSDAHTQVDSSNQSNPTFDYPQPNTNATLKLLPETCAQWADTFSKLELAKISGDGMLMLGAQVKDGVNKIEDCGYSSKGHIVSSDINIVVPQPHSLAQNSPCESFSQKAMLQASLQNYNASNRQYSDLSSTKQEEKATKGGFHCEKKIAYSSSGYSPILSENVRDFTTSEESSPSTKQLTAKLHNLTDQQHQQQTYNPRRRAQYQTPRHGVVVHSQSSFQSSATTSWNSLCPGQDNEGDCENITKKTLRGGYNAQSPAKFLDAGSTSESASIQFRTPHLKRSFSHNNVCGYMPRYCNHPAGTSNDRKDCGCSTTQEKTTGGSDSSTTWSTSKTTSRERHRDTKSSEEDKTSQLRLVKSNPSVSVSSQQSSQVPDSWLDAFTELCVERKTSFKSFVALCKKSRRHRDLVEQKLMEKILSECVSNSKSSKSTKTNRTSLKSSDTDLLEQILQAHRLREVADKFRSDPRTLVDALEKKSLSTLQPLLDKAEKLTDDILLATLEAESSPKYGMYMGGTDTVYDIPDVQEVTSDADTLRSLNLEATLYERESRQLEDVLDRLEQMKCGTEEYRERWTTVRVPQVVDGIFIDQIFEESSVDPSDSYV